MIALIFICFILLSIIALDVVGYIQAKKGAIKVFYNGWDVFGAFVFSTATLVSFFLSANSFSEKHIWGGLGGIVLMAIFSLYNVFFAWKANKGPKGKILFVFFVRTFISILMAICALSLMGNLFPKKDSEGGYPNIVGQLFSVAFYTYAIKKLGETFINA